MAGDSTDGCLPSKMELESSQTSEPLEEEEEVLTQQDCDTQPLDSQELCPASQGLEDGVWGQLYPHCGTFPRLKLDGEKFKIGRSVGDYIIKMSDMGDKRLFDAVSHTQCEITRSKHGVFLTDFSTNGTWVNGHKVGKNVTRPLLNNNDICFTTSTKKVFVFISNEEVSETFPEELTSKYTMSNVLGTGASGEVRLAFRIPDMRRVAVKVIKKSSGSSFTTHKGPTEKQMKNEVKILRTLNHPNIIKLEEVIDTESCLFLVLEIAEGGQLLTKVTQTDRMDEDLVKVYFHQLASAVDYLHSRNICHRDLKLENVLVSSLDENDPVVKITDMGLSKIVEDTDLKTFCGTKSYLAPEVVKSGVGLGDKIYTLKVDCWALGVILYELLSGCPPFTEDRKIPMPLRDQILTADYSFPPSQFSKVSRLAKDLIVKLLKVNPEERFSAAEILEHSWLKDASKDKSKKRKVEEMDLDCTIELTPTAEKKKKM